jgi:hypothetical protein
VEPALIGLARNVSASPRGFGMGPGWQGGSFGCCRSGFTLRDLPGASPSSGFCRPCSFRLYRLCGPGCGRLTVPPDSGSLLLPCRCMPGTATTVCGRMRMGTWTHPAKRGCMVADRARQGRIASPPPTFDRACCHRIWGVMSASDSSRNRGIPCLRGRCRGPGSGRSR